LFTGCAFSEGQIRATLEKNPNLVFDVIEKNPQQFIEVVNRAAKAAQQKQYEMQASQIKEEQDKDLKNPKKPKIESSQVLYGEPNAPITIVEYADFQCPACGMAHRTLVQFQEKYKGKIQFVFKNMPLDFHKMAYPSALYFEAIKLQSQGKALKFHNLLFGNQQDLSESYLKKMAQQVGADMKKLAADINSKKTVSSVEDDRTEFQNFGFTGTPVIILNGVALHGAQPLEELERVAQLTKKQ
jgi:protein-disulfide isomerase